MGRTPDTKAKRGAASKQLPGSVAKTVGVQLRRAREAEGLSQEEVGRFLGYGSSLISSIESGNRRLKVDDLARLCVLLDKTADFFLRDETQEEAQADPRVGLKLRAQIERLPHQGLTDALGSFLDYADSEAPSPEQTPNLAKRGPGGAARDILRRCQVEEPPVDLEQVADCLDIPIINWPFPDALSALVVGTDIGGFVIGVNRMHPLTRRRFSIAHEIAHAVLRHKASYYLEFQDYVSPLGEPSEPSRDRDEREANQFAAALLMDHRWLKRDKQKGLEDPATLAARYRVSEEAMSYRLKNLRMA